MCCPSCPHSDIPLFGDSEHPDLKMPSSRMRGFLAWSDNHTPHRGKVFTVTTPRVDLIDITVLTAAIENTLDPHVLLKPVHNGDDIVDFALVAANAAACAYTRRTRAQLLGATMNGLQPGNTVSENVALFAQVIESGTPLTHKGNANSNSHSTAQRVCSLRAARVGSILSVTWRLTEEHAESV